MRINGIIATFVLLLGVIGAGVSGYVLENLSSFLAPIGQSQRFLSSIILPSGFENLQSQLRQASTQLYQVNDFVTAVVIFFFGTSVLFALVGLMLLVILRKLEKLEREQEEKSPF